mmetsp:Transcript_8201/g.15499  ORF Transcript_8201/g.15499 Transcript_8201/m.15499 type:complete len:226 (+) Transcript_8201:402-1079(+)
MQEAAQPTVRKTQKQQKILPFTVEGSTSPKPMVVIETTQKYKESVGVMPSIFQKKKNPPMAVKASMKQRCRKFAHGESRSSYFRTTFLSIQSIKSSNADSTMKSMSWQTTKAMTSIAARIYALVKSLPVSVFGTTLPQPTAVTTSTEKNRHSAQLHPSIGSYAKMPTPTKDSRTTMYKKVRHKNPHLIGLRPVTLTSLEFPLDCLPGRPSWCSSHCPRHDDLAVE